MAERNGTARWIISAWPVLTSIIGALIFSVSYAYRTQEAILAQVDVRIEQMRAAERTHQAEVLSNYVTIARQNQWETEQTRAMDHLDKSLALLAQVVEQWHPEKR